jgi:hypothetical protein
MEKGDRAVITLADYERVNELAMKYPTFEETKKAIETEFPGNIVVRTPTGISILDKEEFDERERRNN